MLATRPTRTARVGAAILLALVLGSSLAFLSSAVRADLPTLADNGDASKTLAWSMNTTDGLSVSGLDLANGNASLPWRATNVTWDRASQFAGNGTWDPSVSLDPNGITLRADAGNYVKNGDFALNGTWAFEPGLGRNVTSSWNDSSKAAVFRHANEFRWDSMDAVGPWSGINGQLFINTTAKREGTGMVGLNFSLPATPGSFAGALHTGVVNWSGYDRLALWILPRNVSPPVTFNITAFAGSNLRGTSQQALRSGWQELIVNLTELGSSRGTLISLTLRVNGQSVTPTSIYYDDLRLGNAKRFNETAHVRQTIAKSNATSSRMGSAQLRFAWSLPSASGIVRATGTVNMSGPSGTSTYGLGGTGGAWQAFFADVSGTTSLLGFYTLSFALQVAVDNSGPSSVEMRVDNVSVVFPDRHNGTYTSNPVSLGAASQFVRVTWLLDSPSSTVANLGLRSGNESSPGIYTWGGWQTWTGAGTYAPALPPAAFVQVRAELQTTNASRTPTLLGMDLSTRHRAASGSIMSGKFEIRDPLLRWRTLRSVADVRPNSSITFSIGDGNFWQPVPSSGNLTAISPRTFVQWNATLSTTDGLVTPSLERVEFVYEYAGPAVRVEIRAPATIQVDETIDLTAIAFDAGSHTVSSGPSDFLWTTNDSRGSLNNGRYTPRGEGIYRITATSRSTGASGSSNITVVAGYAPWLVGFLSIMPYGIAILAAAVLGFAGYQFVIRRLFAIDDIFLILKDGRLLMHNTRRMRADRDEDIFSGMLTAILAFLRDSDREENGELRRFQIGGKTTLLEKGTHAYLVAVYSGRVPRWAGKDLSRFMASLESAFGDVFVRWTGDPEDLQGLKEFTKRFVSRVRYRPRAARAAGRPDHRGKYTR